MYEAAIANLLHDKKIYDRTHVQTCQLHYAVLMKGKKPVTRWLSNSTNYHAEENVIRNVRRNIKFSHLSLLVVRINKKGELRLSCPCTSCMNLIQKSGIQRVCYSDENGVLIKKKVRDVIHKHSGGYKGHDQNLTYDAALKSTTVIPRA